MVIAGFFALLGHCFPVWLRFRGGKGVATAAGIFGALCPEATVAALILFALVVWFWRYVRWFATAAAAIPLFVYLLWARTLAAKCRDSRIPGNAALVIFHRAKYRLARAKSQNSRSAENKTKCEENRHSRRGQLGDGAGPCVDAQPPATRNFAVGARSRAGGIPPARTREPYLPSGPKTSGSSRSCQ